MAVDLLCPTFPFTSYDLNSPGCIRELVARLEAVQGIETIAEALLVQHRWNIGPNKEPLGGLGTRSIMQQLRHKRPEMCMIRSTLTFVKHEVSC